MGSVPETKKATSINPERILLIFLVLTTSIVIIEQNYMILRVPWQRGEPLLSLSSYEFKYYFESYFKIDILGEHPVTSFGADDFQMHVIDMKEVIAFRFNKSVVGDHYLKYKLQYPLNLNDYNYIAILVHSGEPATLVISFVSQPSYGWRDYTSSVQVGWNIAIIALYDRFQENSFFNSSAISEIWIGVKVVYPSNTNGILYFRSVILYKQLVPMILLELSPIVSPIEIVHVYVNGQSSEYISVSKHETISLSVIYPYVPDKTYVIELVLNYAPTQSIIVKSPSLAELALKIEEP